MLYQVNNKIQSEATNTYMESGIHENVWMDSVVYKQTDNGNKFLAFYFKNNAGETVSKTEWEVKNSDRVTQEQYEAKITNQISRIKQIVTKYIPEESYNFEVNSFEDFCNRTIQLLGTAFNDKKMRLKVVYDNKGYTTLPNYSKYQFIESMDIPTDKSKIKILGIDQMERTSKDNGYDKETPSLGIESMISMPQGDGPANSTGDLPF